MSARQADITIRVGGSSAATINKRATALDRLASSLLRVGTAMKGSNTAASGMVSASRKVESSANRATRATGRAKKGTNAFGTSVKNGANALDNFGTLFRRMIRIMASYFVITQVITAFREFTTMLVSAPAMMELWNTQLRVLSGSATLAAERMQMLIDVAIETPLELPDLLQGLTSLEAFNVEISERTLPLLADLAAVTGRTFEDVAQVIGKVIAGSPQAITRSLPRLAISPIEFKALAAELNSRSEALWQIIQNKFEGFAKESATTVIGVYSNIKDAFFAVMAEVGEGLMDSLRDVLQGTMDWIEELRHSPAELQKLQDKVRVVADSLVNFGTVLVKVGGHINAVIEAVGGLVNILKVLTLLLTVKLAWAFGVALSTINPWVAAVVVAIPLASKLLSLFSDGGAQRKATKAQEAFADELERTNKLMRTGMTLVEADVRQKQGMALAMVGGRLSEFAGRTDAGFLQDEAYQSTMAQARMLAGALPDERSDFAMDALRRMKQAQGKLQLAVRGDQPMGVKQEYFKDYHDALNDLADIFSSTASMVLLESKEIRKAVGKEVVPPPEAESAWKEFSYDVEAALKRILDMREEFYRRDLTQPFTRMKTRFELGLVDPAVAKSQAEEMYEALRTQVIELIESKDDIDIEVGMRLKADLSGMEAFLKQFEEKASDMSTALENVLRRGFKTAADNIAKAVSEGGFVAMIKTTFGVALNLLGDSLIQFGMGLEAFQKAINALIAGVPGIGAVVAITAGIALKAFASTLMKNTGNQISGGGGYSSSGGSGPTSVTYPRFNPSEWSTAGGNSYNIYAWDSKSMKQFLEENESEFGGLMGRVVKVDRDTGGAKYGLNLATAR